MQKTEGIDSALVVAESEARWLLNAVLGFLLAAALAGSAVAALFRLIYFPWVPLKGRFAAVALALSIGVWQAFYAVPIFLWARRRGVFGFCTGFRAGAFTIVLLNALLLAAVAVSPDFED